MAEPDSDFARYHRQMLLPAFGEEGQRRLRSSTVLLVGCGALGTVVADALTRAGVGCLVIVDRDIVETTNLQRQVLFDEADARAGLPKAEAAARRLNAINGEVRVVPIVADLTSRNVEAIVGGSSTHGAGVRAGVVIDGTDNFQTRYLLNDVCVKLGIPLVYGGAVGTTGMTMTILPEEAAPGRATPCLRCIFPDAPQPGSTPTCDTAGILGPAAGIVASLQAAEAIKVVLGRIEAVARGLRQVDLWSNRWREIDVGAPRRGGGGVQACPCCGLRRFEFLDAPADNSAVLCGADAVQVTPGARGAGSAGITPVDLEGLGARLSRHGEFARSGQVLRGLLEAERLGLTVFRDGRAIIRGTREPVRARAIYAKYIGD